MSRPPKLGPDSPVLLQTFRRHLEDGWSPISFTARLMGGYRAYLNLKLVNALFRELADQYTQERHRAYIRLHPEVYHLDWAGELTNEKEAGVRKANRAEDIVLSRGRGNLGGED